MATTSWEDQQEKRERESNEYFEECRDTVTEIRAAMRGKKLPRLPQDSVNRLAVVYGIRHCPGFASELHSHPDYPEITRALNARSIMSNVIPDMVEPQEFPYCIWHPDLASEATYRSLATRYPQMRYHVGRACAVAGYTELYHELALLPEVSVAEEARDSAKGGAIFNSIMATPFRYAVMDDYTRSVNLESPSAPAFLNCDTALCSSIDVPQKSTVLQLARLDVSGFADTPYFDITECRGVCHYRFNKSPYSYHSDNWYVKDTTSESKALASQLCSPLPTDLPNVNKDLLILEAAYSGHIDRYIRLRRPMMISGEIPCLVRGIYHNTMFAKWWSQQPEAVGNLVLQSAINARFIMNNDLSRITDETPDSHIPRLIHRPIFADPLTYEELARRKPFMAPHCARVSIRANYQGLFDRLKFKPEFKLALDARHSHNPYYLQELQRRAAELQINIDTANDDDALGPDYMNESTTQTTTLLTNISAADVLEADEDPIFPSYQADIGLIEVFVCAPESALHGVYTDEFFEKQCRPNDISLPVDGRPSRLYLPGSLPSRGRGRGRGHGHVRGW